MTATALDALQYPATRPVLTGDELGMSEDVPTSIGLLTPRPIADSSGQGAGASPTLETSAEDVPDAVRPGTRQLALPRRLAVTVALQEWEGIVDWVEGDEFGATLDDMTSPDSHEQERDTFSLDEVSRDDLSLVKPGAVFYWTIALVTNEVGRRSYDSLVRFRRLPAWRPQDLNEARERGAALARRLHLP